MIHSYLNRCFNQSFKLSRMQVAWFSPGYINLILLTSLALLKCHLTLEEGKGLCLSKITIYLPAGPHLLGTLKPSLRAPSLSKLCLRTCPSANCSVSRAMLRLRISSIQMATLLESLFFIQASHLFSGHFVPGLLGMSG